MEPEILENEGIPKMKENSKLPETALIIETFNRIGGVNYGAKNRRELENGNNSIPIRTPRFHCVRIFFAHLNSTSSRIQAAVGSSFAV